MRTRMLDVGDKRRAEEFLNRTLDTSFGIGYRKDYQLDQWIDWLGKINEIEPDNAVERISNFVTAIENLEDSIESRPLMLAARRLLAVTSKTSPFIANRLFFRFLDKGIIGFQSGLRSLMMETLNQPDQPSDVWMRVFVEVVIPFDPDGDTKLVETVVLKSATTTNREGLIAIATSLVSQIRRLSPPSARPKWFRGLSEGLFAVGISPANIGLNEDDLNLDPSEAASSRCLTLNDGSQLIDTDIELSQVESFDDVRALKEMESQDSFFDWTRVVSTMVPKIQDVETLEDLASLFLGSWHVSNVLSVISTRIAELGQSERAWEIANDAYRASSDYGWGKWYDGGTRLNAVRAMKNADRDRATQLIYDSIAEDFAKHPELLTLDWSALENIVELTDTSDKTAEIWAEVEAYTDELLRTDPDPKLIEMFDASTSKDTPDAALVEFMAELLDHPCLSLAQAAQRGIGNLLIQGNPDVADILDGCLSTSEGHQERVLILIDAVSRRNPESVSWLRTRVHELNESDNWSIRLKAQSIAGNCGWPIVDSDGAMKPLPPIFGLTLLEDAAENRIAAPFDTWIERIAEMANVDANNLSRRVRNKMDILAPHNHEWTEQAEELIATSLRRVGLQMPHSSVRYRIAQRALHHAVAELADANRISVQDQLILANRLSDYDPDMVLTDPCDRPNQIRSIVRLNFNDDRQEWLENARESLPSTEWNADDGRIVVAEVTRLKKSGNYYKPTESRFCIVGPSDLAEEERESDPARIFAPMFKGLVSQYPRATPNARPSTLAVRNIHFGYDSPGADWLAFNPETARQLGWSQLGDGIFRWVDDKGDTMVESVWWADGKFEFEPTGRDHGEVGEGWIVVATEAAVEQIVERFGPLSRMSIVQRSVVENGRPETNSATSTRPI